MDPLLFALLVGWFIARGTVEDTAYALRGKTSPRQQYRQKYGPTAGSKIARAAADRIADRIAQGPKDKPPPRTKPKRESRFRQWARDVGEDAKRSARQGVNDFSAWRERRRTANDAGQAGDRTEPPGGVHGDHDTRRRWWQWHQPPPPQPETDPEPEHGPVYATAEREGPTMLTAGTGGDIPDVPPGVEDTPTRRGDGQPETDADRRFFDAREGGYTGWIDQDGHQVLDLDAWMAEQKRAHSSEVMDAELVEPSHNIGYLDPPSAHSCATDVRGSTQATATPIEEGTPQMSAPAEHGLAAYQNYAQELQTACDNAVTSIEATVASMEADEFSGTAVDGFRQAAEQFEAAKAAVAESIAALEQSNTVKDAYLAAQHTGSREAVLAE
ncbi:hypothetical protein [Prauserella endophytica]|uniref:Uncharacterized protein n=1 Tax=Prauserella endophytica TaxID=1592324 RepID=A0ABY2RVP2_9PSEU|nr:hypothetical protein [Prauserella endophytica]TKG61559.1 hypothetical protein FCN18_33515 [Prauserella endophytica]